VTELTDRPFELLGSQAERDQDMQMELHDTADSQTTSGLLTPRIF